LLALFLTGAYLINNYFFTYPVIVSVLRGAALISMLVIAETIVLASGGIDLSVAGTCLLSSSIIFYMVETNTTGVFAAVLISIAAASAIGLLNGLFVAKLDIQPVIVTLGTSLLTRGVAGAITNNISIFDTCPEFDVFKTTLFFIPGSLIAALAVMGVCCAIFRYTIVGRQIFAVGGSERSAQLSGLNVGVIKIYTFFAAGLIAGLGGMMVLADSTMAARFFGGGAELEIIFAAILGGAAVSSRAKIFFRTCIGAGVIAVINRLIYGLFVFNYMRMIIVGLLFLIIIAMKRNMFKGGKISD
jgi:ribose/xylose/arabinose/galactoside ABC-type transport system permease subunit